MTPRPQPDDRLPAGTTPPSGDQWVIGHGHQRAVVTEVGATLRSFTVDDRPFIEGFEANRVEPRWSRSGTGALAKSLGRWAIHVRGGPGRGPAQRAGRRNAIHGLVRWMPWKMASRAQNRVTMACVLHPSPGYPFTLGLQVEYRLGRDGLTVLAEAENLGGEARSPSAWASIPTSRWGHHTVDTLRLTVPADRRLVTDERGLPTGDAPVGEPSSTSPRAASSVQPVSIPDTRRSPTWPGWVRTGEHRSSRRGQGGSPCGSTVRSPT